MSTSNLTEKELAKLRLAWSVIEAKVAVKGIELTETDHKMAKACFMLGANVYRKLFNDGLK